MTQETMYKFGIGVAIGCGCVAAYFGNKLIKSMDESKKKYSDIANKLNTSMRQLEEKGADMITDRMVKEALENAAEEQTEIFMNKVKNDIHNIAVSQLKGAAKDAVREAEKEIKEAVQDEITIQVANIDISAMKKEVRKEAEEKVLSKFDDDLQDLLDKFNTNLSHIQKIYGGIAKTLEKNNEKPEEKKLSFTVG